MPTENLFPSVQLPANQTLLTKFIYTCSAAPCTQVAFPHCTNNSRQAQSLEIKSRWSCAGRHALTKKKPPPRSSTQTFFEVCFALQTLKKLDGYWEKVGYKFGMSRRGLFSFDKYALFPHPSPAGPINGVWGRDEPLRNRRSRQCYQVNVEL